MAQSGPQTASEQDGQGALFSEISLSLSLSLSLSRSLSHEPSLC